MVEYVQPAFYPNLVKMQLRLPLKAFVGLLRKVQYYGNTLENIPLAELTNHENAAAIILELAVIRGTRKANEE